MSAVNAENQLSSSLREAMDSLTKTETPRLQETVFVKYFLPIFAGVLGPNKPAPVARWLEVAGSPNSPVDIYRGNEFLFQVPPLLSDAGLTAIPGGGQSVYEIVLTAQKKYDVMPALGNQHLNYWLRDRVRSNGIDLKTLEKWNSIFTRYGMEPIVAINPTTTQKEVTSNESKPDDPEVYEEL